MAPERLSRLVALFREARFSPAELFGGAWLAEAYSLGGEYDKAKQTASGLSALVSNVGQNTTLVGLTASWRSDSQDQTG